MAEGGSFFGSGVGEPSRRAFFELDRRISQLSEDLTAGDVSFAGDVEIDGTLTANHIHGNLAGAVYLHVKNTSGVTIPAGSPVYATGSVGASGATEVAISDADVPSTMPALGVLQSALGNNGEGHATVLGVAKQLDTSAWSVNDSLYVSTSGTLTNVRPTGASELVQKIGRVIRSDASTGEILVLGAGRTNDVPNGLSPTITLAGDASGSVTLTDLSDGTLTVAVADDSHNHTIANVDNLQTTLDGKAESSHTHSYLPLSGGTVTGTVVATVDLEAQGNVYVGKNGGSDSNAFFYDDNSNTWRTLQWDDSANDWAVEDNGGTMRTMWHSGNHSPGLHLINDTHVGSGVTSVTISNVFSSTYDNYRIIIDQMDASVGGVVLCLRMDTYSGAVYDEGGYYIIYSTGTNGMFSGYGATFFGAGYTDPNNVTSAVIDVIGPNIARHTKFYSQSSGDNVQRSLVGRLRYNVAHTGFRIFPSSGTFTGGSIRTYGYSGT